MKLDLDARETWARDMAQDRVYEYGYDLARDATDIDWVMYFLVNHPIEGLVRDEKYYPIEDIKGYCPSCSEPVLTSEDTCHVCGDPIPEGSKTLHWPPGAPWPPSRDFFGRPMEVKAFEESEEC